MAWYLRPDNKGSSEGFIMQDDERESQAKALQKFVVEQMNLGAHKLNICQQLVQMGVDNNEAGELVDIISETADEERMSYGSILPALVGGVIAALVGGVLWGKIVIITGYEIGFMACGIGLLSGLAVVLFARGKRGVPLQVFAVLSSVLGIIMGKYFIHFHFLKEAVAQEHGTAAASNVSMFSEGVIQVFLENAYSMVDGFDILWLILAVITAWEIPQGLGIQRRTSQQQIPPGIKQCPKCGRNIWKHVVKCPFCKSKAR